MTNPIPIQSKLSQMNIGPTYTNGYTDKPNGIYSFQPSTVSSDDFPEPSPRSIHHNLLNSLGHPPQRTYTSHPNLVQAAVAVRKICRSLGRRKIKWTSPKRILIVSKPGDKKVAKKAKELVTYLLEDIKIPSHLTKELENNNDCNSLSLNEGSSLDLYIDPHLTTNKYFDYSEIQDKISRSNNKSTLQTFSPEMCQFSADQFDLVLTLGGDGTVLYTSWLFQNMVPPVIPFHLGSLGFLSSFDFAEYRETLNNCFKDGVKVNLRMRLTCTVFRYNQTKLKSSKSNGVLNEVVESKSSSNLLQVPSSKSSRKSKKKGHKINHSRILLQEFEDQEDDDAESGINLPDSSLFTKGESFEVLNELVVDRGPSPFMSLIELYVNGEMLTTVQADGLTVATPTGSTAYSLSAGGSLVHPEIPALLITPNCPHTLSFRPMLLPDTSVLHLCVPFSARGTAWASFDGRGSIELKRGDYIRIQSSSSPFPTVCKGSSPGSEWFNSLNRCLNWNQRALQKSFNSEESSNDELDTESDYSTSNE